jgi:D-arabinose 1-dehydrogenase-like Zn-dependent alcohol dehydrogenase
MKEGQRFQLTVATTSITADEEYTLHISDKLELSGVALVMCGIYLHYVV